MRKYKRNWRQKAMMWFYQLTLEDVKKGFHQLMDGLGAVAAIGSIFLLLYILPHFFH